jgi:hypothetical protein
MELTEGSRIVKCAFCDQRSWVRGDRGVIRYQIERKIEIEQAISALRQFFTGQNKAIGLADRAKIEELFVTYIPFWSIWARVAGWVFGEKKRGSGDDTYYEPREEKVLAAKNWNAPACDVTEFGIEAVPIDGRPLTAFNNETLHEDGMVFEPIGTMDGPLQEAQSFFQKHLEKKLDRIQSTFLRLLNLSVGLVYYPLWFARYSFKGRTYQVLIDGQSGDILYGKAPGNLLYRAGVLVVGMGLGAFLAINVSALIISTLIDKGTCDGWVIVLVTFAVGIGMMMTAYRRFRYGEVIEEKKTYRLEKEEKKGGLINWVMDKLNLEFRI